MSGSATASLASLTALDGVGVASGLTAAPAAGAAVRVLPVRAELADLLPWGGLRRGSTVAVRGAASVLLALLAAATSSGSWAAAVALPGLGVLAAAELGVAVRRLAVVPRPGAELADVVAALLDGFDLVAVSGVRLTGTGRGGASLARRLSARARQRGAVLLSYGAWPGADVELCCSGPACSPVRPGIGHGHLRSRDLVIGVTGRGAAARPARRELALASPPGPPGPPSLTVLPARAADRRERVGDRATGRREQPAGVG